MKKSALRRNLFLGSFLMGAAVCGSALAQDAQSTAPQEVVVTGSRIRSAGLTSISPVTTVTSAEVKLEGITRIEDLLNDQPEVFAAQGSNIANGSNGTATVDLRGLGSNRTLVLIDGRRVVPGDPGAPAVDLNNIPAQLVDRVEIVTGGASAVYGSDAISGVVNFVMKKNFVGVQIDAQGSFYNHDNNYGPAEAANKASGYAYPQGGITDGYTETVNFLLGVESPDGKGNLEMYATYRNVEAVLEADRDYTACTLAESGSNLVCSGSSTTSPPRLLLVSTANGGTGTAGASYTTVGTGANATLRAYNGATDSFNFGPYNYLQRPDVRYNLGAMGHYEISPMADVYAQFMFMDDNSTAQIAPGGIFFGTNYTIPCSNSFLTPSELQTFCGGSTNNSFVLRPGKRNVEGGGRQSDFRHTSYRLVTGMRGDLDKTWSYDGYIQYATTIEEATAQNYFSSARIANALAGCPTATVPACVPYNLFQGGGATVTPAQLAYLQVPGITGGQTVEQVANLTLSGKLGNYGVKSPWASDGVNVALGTEYRRENITQYADAEQEAGDLSGSGGAVLPIGGTFDVYELFGEAAIPLVNDKPFAYSANLHLAYRWSDYSTAGNAQTYAIQGDWSPVKDLRLRADFQRAVRAPNVLELFSPANVILANYTDPCQGPVTNLTPTLAQCERSGLTAAQYGSSLTIGSSANQNNVLSGGNTSLKPEVADTYSVGGVFQPHFLPGFSASVDYFNIFVANVIQSGVASPTTVLNNCEILNQSYYCGLIHRDASGSLGATNGGYIIANNVNAGSLQTSGVDVDVNYRTSLSTFGLNGLGSIAASFQGTYLNSLITESLPTSGIKADCAGFYGQQCGTPNPKWRHTARLTWTTPWYGIQLSGAWRYFGDAKVDVLGSGPLAGSVAGVIPDEKLPAKNYFDATVSWKVFDKYQFRVGAKNVFDSRPPIVGSTECPTGICNGNVYAQSYDSLGRYIFAGMTASF